MPKRKNISSGSKWESAFGFSRAVQINDWLFVSKTGPTASTGEIVSDDILEQTKCALENIDKVLQANGFRIEDVVQSKLYLTDISRWEEVAGVHGEYFRTTKPVFTLLHVLPFPEKKMKVAIDIAAYRG